MLSAVSSDFCQREGGEFFRKKGHVLFQKKAGKGAERSTRERGTPRR